MTIVASNNLTVSNINDGTITHVAFAYSADGTDRFTTVYPNLNLLTNSRLQTNNIYPWIAISSTLSVRKNGLTVSSSQIPKNGDTGAVQYDFPFAGGKSYTISCYVLNNSQTPITSFKLQFRFESPTGSTYPSKVFENSVSSGVLTKFEFTAIAPQNATKASAYFWVRSIADNSSFNFDITDMKVEESTISTPWMPSKTEVKPSDYPTYRGEYSDKLTTQSQLPSDYKWLAFQGPTGDTGNGVKSTDVSYQTGVSGTVTPTGTWIISVPTLIKGQYLWTRTVWTYTDNTSKTGYSVSYISVDGSKGDPTGVTKQATEPDSSQRFIGMLWQYTGTSSISITGTTATPNAIYRWIGTAWELWYFYAVNIQADTISAISGNLGTMVAGVIKILADIIVNAAGNTKKFGMLFTKKGLLSTGPVFNSSAQISDTKMAAASLTQGELRFLNMDYSEDLEAVQEYATSSANNGYIRFSSTPEKGDVLEITASNILLDGRTTQTSPWIEASSFAKYRVAFGTVTVSVGLVNGGTSNTIYLGSIPTALRPLDGRMFPAPAWWVDTSRDRHFQINADQGNMSLLSPYPGQEYRFEVTWTIPM